MKRYKVIIDTDPGVDDANAIVLALNDPRFDIKLFSVSHGNCPLAASTRNVCHLLDAFDKKIPVVEGYNERMGGSEEEAIHMHTVTGLGNYHSPEKTKTKPIKKDCADAMREVIKKYPHEIYIFILGPHTNFAHLLQKHPEVKDLIKGVYMMGGAPLGTKQNPNHISFNVRSDIPAFKISLESGLPIVMCPSNIGRDGGYYTEEQVEALKNKSEVGRFLAKAFETYWEPGYPDKRISVNDISTLYCLTHPRIFKMKKADIELSEDGRTIPHFTRKGQFTLVLDVNRKKFQKIMFKGLDALAPLHPKFVKF